VALVPPGKAEAKLKLRSGEMVLVKESCAEVLAQLRVGDVISLTRADGHANAIHLPVASIDYVEDVAG
jgi:hypothetical protein